MSNGNTLIGNAHSSYTGVIEVDYSKNIIWEKTGLANPHDAKRLINNITLIADTSNNRVIEVNSSGDIIWSFTDLNQPVSVERIVGPTSNHPPYKSIPPKKPDLTLSENDIYINGRPTFNKTIKIFAEIHNNGNIKGTATIKFYEDVIDDEYLIGTVNRISVPANGFYNTSTDWTPKTKGKHTIIVVIENCEPPESNLENNKNQIKVVVLEEEIKIDERPIIPLNPITIISFSMFALLALSVFGTEIVRYKFLTLLFIPLYTRIKKEEVLDHFVRGQIYGVIKSKPGIHYSEIMRQIGIGNGTLSYHLHMLEKQGFIKSINDGRLKHFIQLE